MEDIATTGRNRYHPWKLAICKIHSFYYPVKVRVLVTVSGIDSGFFRGVFPESQKGISLTSKKKGLELIEPSNINKISLEEETLFFVWLFSCRNAKIQRFMFKHKPQTASRICLCLN